MHKALRKCLVFQVDSGFIIANCAAQVFYYFFLNFTALLCLCRGRLLGIRTPAIFCTLPGTNALHGVIKKTSCGGVVEFLVNINICSPWALIRGPLIFPAGPLMMTTTAAIFQRSWLSRREPVFLAKHPPLGEMRETLMCIINQPFALTQVPHLRIQRQEN